MPSSTTTRLIIAMCAAWFGAPFSSFASDQDGRFIEFPGDTDTMIWDLSTVQIIQPGRFTIVSTTIDNPDVMKFKLKVLDTLRTYCTRADGLYPVLADIFTLGPPDRSVESIKVSQPFKMRIVDWSYPYSKVWGTPTIFCRSSTERGNYFELVATITNGFRKKWLFDCKRGLEGLFLNEFDDPAKAETSLVRRGTNGFLWYLAVCQRVTHEPPYLPK